MIQLFVTTKHNSRFYNSDFIIDYRVKLLIIIKIVILLDELKLKDASKRPLSIPPLGG